MLVFAPSQLDPNVALAIVGVKRRGTLLVHILIQFMQSYLSLLAIHRVLSHAVLLSLPRRYGPARAKPLLYSSMVQHSQH